MTAWGFIITEHSDEEDDQPLYKTLEISGVQVKMKLCITC